MPLQQGTLDGVCAGVLLYLGYALLMFDFPEDARTHCVPEETAYDKAATAAREATVAGRPASAPALVLASWPWRRFAMFLSLWVGAGFMAFIGRYL